jgi:pimeloyl-ACP methyl ester carboxylesterase
MKSIRTGITLLVSFYISQLSFAQDDDFIFYSDLARDWYEAGQYFEWTSTTADNDAAKVNIFYRTWGDNSKPKLLLIHGFPNSSFDYYKLIPLLENDYYIATLDFPGSGFSDKPLNDFNYMLTENALIVEHFVREVVEFDDFALYTHDRGVSIGLALLSNYLDNPDRGYQINYHFISNSGMFLPLATLVPFQTALLDAQAGPRLIAARSAQARLTNGDAEAVALSDVSAFNDGIAALLYVGRYQLERQANETRWLQNLPRSPIPVALLWGLTDDINPIRIANHVWDNYLNERVAPSSFWILPTAGHYPQRDNPQEVAGVLQMALSGQLPAREVEPAFMRQYNGRRTGEEAIYVGHSRIEPLNFPSSIEYNESGYRLRAAQ